MICPVSHCLPTETDLSHQNATTTGIDHLLTT